MKVYCRQTFNAGFWGDPGLIPLKKVALRQGFLWILPQFFKPLTNFIANFCAASIYPWILSKLRHVWYISQVAPCFIFFLFLTLFFSVRPSNHPSIHLSICMSVCLSHFFFIFFFDVGVTCSLIDVSHSLYTALIGTTIVGFTWWLGPGVA